MTDLHLLYCMYRSPTKKKNHKDTDDHSLLLRLMPPLSPILMRRKNEWGLSFYDMYAELKSVSVNEFRTIGTPSPVYYVGWSISQSVSRKVFIVSCGKKEKKELSTNYPTTSTCMYREGRECVGVLQTDCVCFARREGEFCFCAGI